MTGVQKATVLMAAAVTLIGARQINAAEKVRGDEDPCSGIQYVCYQGELGCLYPWGHCNDYRFANGCGSVVDAWCTLVGCGGADAVACVFHH